MKPKGTSRRAFIAGGAGIAAGLANPVRAAEGEPAAVPKWMLSPGAPMRGYGPAAFWQIHRSTIVNVNAIAGVSRDFAGHVIVKLKNRKETLPVSQPFAHRFRQM